MRMYRIVWGFIQRSFFKAQCRTSQKKLEEEERGLDELFARRDTFGSWEKKRRFFFVCSGKLPCFHITLRWSRRSWVNYIYRLNDLKHVSSVFPFLFAVVFFYYFLFRGETGRTIRMAALSCLTCCFVERKTKWENGNLKGREKNGRKKPE